MIENKKFLTPIIPSPPPPKHTEIQPRCFICKHFNVCSIRSDYLKTAQLIQNVLGAPCDSYEISSLPFVIPNFEGITIENWQDYFPEIITTTNNNTGYFYMAKYQYSKCGCKDNYIKFIYIVNKYYILFTAVYNEETKEFDASAGKDICYGSTCEIASDLELLQIGLLTLWEDIQEEANKPKDVINTTAFSAQLDCKYYEWEKGLDYNEGIKRIVAQYPDGVPIGPCGELYHLATYHIENQCVPCYHPENGHPVFIPMPYPLYVPPKKNNCNCKKAYTRDEMNEF